MVPQSPSLQEGEEVKFEPWHEHSEVARGADEAEIRAFAVAPWARGRGVGKVLLEALVERARAAGAARLVLLSLPAMVSAQHLYRVNGFERVPERDWQPRPGVSLRAYRLTLGD